MADAVWAIPIVAMACFPLGAMAEQTLGHCVPGQYGGLFDPDLDDQLLVGEDPVGLVGLDVRNCLIALPC